MIFKRVIQCLPITLLVSLVLVTGCQIGGSTAFIQGDTPEDNNRKHDGSPVTGDMVILNMLDEPESLNPYTSSSASATNIYRYIYETFLEYEHQPPWDLVPLLVESMPEASQDHLTYTWTLRPDIKWHDGRPMTLEDIEFSLKAIMNPYVDDLPSKPYYQELDSLEIDGMNVIMHCSQPYFRHIDFLGGFSVLPKHVYDEQGLMDGIRYFHVKLGSVFGYMADLLESETEMSMEEFVPLLTLTRIEKTIKSVSDGNLDWNNVKEAVRDYDQKTPVERLHAVLDFLYNHPNGVSAARMSSEVMASANKVIASLPLAVEIKSSAEPGEFPRRSELAKFCRDYHDRIEAFGKQFNTHPQGRNPTVGSGVYKFEKWTTGQEIILSRNENYWKGEGYAFLDKIIYRVLTDQTASLVALKNGEIDFMESLQTIQYLTMTNRSGFLDKFIKGTYLIPSYSYLGWRNGHPIFSDKRVRRAMTHMVRRKDIIEKLEFGFGEIVTGNFYRYGPDYDSTIVPYEYDPVEAQRLLAEAGWSDVDEDGILEKGDLEFRFEMLISIGSPLTEQITSILREDLFMIGIEMDIRRLEWSVFINNYIRNHNFDACLLGWVFGMKGDPKQVWHSESATGRGSNHVEFINAEADSLIDAARIEFDQEKRVAMYHRFQQILHEEQPYTFMFSRMRKPAYDRRFKGVRWYPFRPGYQLEEWFVPKAEQKYIQ